MTSAEGQKCARPSRVSQATVVENARVARAFPRCRCQQTRTPTAGFTQDKPQKCGRDARLSKRAVPPVTDCRHTYGKKMPAIGHTERMFPVRQSQQRRTGDAFAGELSGKTCAGCARFQGSPLSGFGPPRTAMRRQRTLDSNVCQSQNCPLGLAHLLNDFL